MSIATDRLTAADRRVIIESLLTEPKPHKSDEIGGHCPFHKEETPGGAFFYNFEIDAAHCHSCGQDSDLVGIFNAVSGRDVADPDGCAEFVQRYCDGTLPVNRERKPRQKREWKPKQVGTPPQLWMEKAASFVEHSVERLQSNPERLAELLAWGIDAETACKCRFGWNDRDKWPPVTSWGLPHELNDNDKEKKVWLPEGLVMPAVHDGQVVKLKIRRPNPVTPWGENRKYWEVKGGANNLFHVYGSPASRIWVMMETERDAALVWKHVHVLGIGAIGNGGAAKRPGGYVADILGRAKLILNALDFDQAGASNSYDFWEKEYPVSVRWPAPPSMGKDVGDAISNGLDIRQWVLDGLPGFIKRWMSRGNEPVVAVPNKKQTVVHSPEKSWFEQVLDMLDNLPLWRDELASFRVQLQDNEFKLFMGGDGRPWVGVTDQSVLQDRIVMDALGAARKRFYEWRVLDEWIGESSLEDIVIGYFGDKLEVRG